MEDKQIKFGIELPASLRKRMKAVANERDVKLKDAYRIAVESWIGGREKPRVTPIASESAWQRKLRLILESGHKRSIDGIQLQLDTFLALSGGEEGDGEAKAKRR